MNMLAKFRVIPNDVMICSHMSNLNLKWRYYYGEWGVINYISGVYSLVLLDHINSI